MAINQNVLIVEDDDVYRDLLRIIFQAEGWMVIEAENGEDALHRLDLGYFPALIVTDLNMPELDGVALIEALESRGRFASTPVVICSSRELSMEEQRRVDDQAIAYLRKNELTPQRLAYEIQQIISTLGLPHRRAGVSPQTQKAARAG